MVGSGPVILDLTMCMVLYVAADAQLPTVEFDQMAPGFNARPIDQREEPVRKHFSKSQVYFLGAHTWCSCGFSYGRGGDDDVLGRESVERLLQYLSEALQRVGPLELYACWDGDESEPSIQRTTVTPAYFGGEAFELTERWFAHLVEGPSPFAREQR